MELNRILSNSTRTLEMELNPDNLINITNIVYELRRSILLEIYLPFQIDNLDYTKGKMYDFRINAYNIISRCREIKILLDDIIFYISNTHLINNSKVFYYINNINLYSRYHREVSLEVCINMFKDIKFLCETVDDTEYLDSIIAIR